MYRGISTIILRMKKILDYEVQENLSNNMS